ncbi:MAG: DEAD/DEAH box helicase [Candidatus Delongbacteria bacterium]|jgi:ATP-dependent RNA helicase DeaD|nr:DEAD/DEAH box helicase [Candidatus Delongbacteria bacterium]
MPSIFSKLNINDNLVNALNIEKISTPTSIQEQAIPFIFENKDIIASSDTGTGKTLAYLLPILQRLDENSKALQVVILAPTYELVIQIQKQIESLIKNSGIEITAQPILGSVHIKRQIENLKKKKPQIIVASTGRLLELISRKRIKMHTVKTIILDEADKLIDANNMVQTKAVIKTTMKDRQLMAFSATIPNSSIDKLTQMMKEPKVIQIEDDMISTLNISHEYIVCDPRDKIKVLRNLAANIKNLKAIVFINRSDELEVLADKLKYHNLKVDCIHGSWEKAEREKAIRDFRNNKINLLVASDIAARGLDFKGVTHIISIDVPEDSKNYTHRAGRTGRAGEKGTSISIVTEYEVQFLQKFERKLQISIKLVDKLAT